MACRRARSSLNNGAFVYRVPYLVVHAQEPDFWGVEFSLLAK